MACEKVRGLIFVPQTTVVKNQRKLRKTRELGSLWLAHAVRHVKDLIFRADCPILRNPKETQTPHRHTRTVSTEIIFSRSSVNPYTGVS